MSTKSLYQKYRPSKFNEVIGQDRIVSTLTNQLENQTVNHAYLFSGSRGLGKTSIARILAGELQINNEDLYEIDAASNRGIDDIREIRDGVKALPFSSPYKMYLIDEVHMLTKEAFNALLKTLEEPPNYVVFVLATTEAHKVPDTIKSRTQLFNFTSPTITDISELISRVAQAESSKVDQTIVTEIAKRANGSYRGALGQLQTYLANPADFMETKSDADMRLQTLEALGSGSGMTKSDIINMVQSIENPSQWYQNLLTDISDTLFQQLDNSQQPSQLTIQHLKKILEFRNQFSGDNPDVARSSLLVLLVEMFA
jgi:DNA polymerase-3 subunit gamma/tau